MIQLISLGIGAIAFGLLCAAAALAISRIIDLLTRIEARMYNIELMLCNGDDGCDPDPEEEPEMNEPAIIIAFGRKTA